MSDSFQPGLHLIHGNRVEDLRDLLVALLQKYPPAPLEPAVFLVQSNGIAQWLKLRLAAPEAWHIAAAVDMQMPARFLWQAYRAVLGPDTVPAESPFDKERLTWRLMRLLPGWLDEPLFAELAHFLRDDDDLRKRYQLAAELADLFDQYQVYRADWLAAWSAGRDELISPRGVREPLPESQRWQAELWRRVLADLPPDESHLSRAEMHRQFIGQVRTGTGLLPGLPRRLFVFGLSALPQQALEALHALSTRLQIYLFVHNPCRYYWADIIEERELLQPLRPSHAAKPGLAALDQVELAAAANPLLAAWGKQGRDFIGLLYQYDQASAGSQQIDLFQPFVETPGSGSLLAQLQQGILDLEPPASPPLPVDPADRSITFHLAHSRQREVEVLHDQLLAMFDEATRAGRRLEPRDVIVMVPDIDVYAPHIEAVFGNIAPQDERYIPYTVADRPTRATSPLMTAVETLLQLPDQRFAASEVLALLQVPAVCARYGIEEADLPRLQQWIGESGIRWGLDAGHRERFALPPLAQNSWRFGLERMLMGYAVGDGDGWNGIEPYAEPSGQAATLVGDIAAMLEGLQRHGRLLGRDHAPAEWGTLLRELWHDFLQAESAQDQLVLDQLDAALERWLEACAAAGLADPLPLTVVREALLAGFDATGISQRFLAGSVNFCTLMPMRAIPFPVVCLLGMNDGDYPRLRPPADFDLMAGRYRPGDRSRREDDRYLFLEALLSARERLYISYIGRDERDNSERRASVLVGQLCDHIAAGWVREDGEPLLASLTTEHPLQPFSRRYLDPNGPADHFTYAREWFSAPAMQADELPLPAPAMSEEPLTLEALGRFLRSPAEHFFRERLGTRLERRAVTVEDDEPFDLDGLAQHSLRSALVEAGRHAMEQGDDAVATELARTVSKLRGEGALPPGAGGDLLEAELLARSEETLANWRQILVHWPGIAEPQEIELALGNGLRVQDWLADGALALRTNDTGQLALIECRASQAYAGRGRYKFHYFPQLWIRHLAGRACGLSLTTILVTTDGIHRLPALTAESARIALRAIGDAWLAGLCQPLPIEIKTAMSWLHEDKESDEPDSDNAALVRCYEGDYHTEGEVAKSAVLTRCWPTFGELHAAGFGRWARQLYLPLSIALSNMEHEL